MTDIIVNKKIEEKLSRLGIQAKFTKDGNFVHVTIPYVDIGMLDKEHRRAVEKQQKRLKLSFEIYTDPNYLKKLGFHKLTMRD